MSKEETTDAGEHDQMNISDSPSMAIITGVANVKGEDPLELTPLYEYFDADALDDLLESAIRENTSVEITFEYEGVTVSIDDSNSLTFENHDD